MDEFALIREVVTQLGDRAKGRWIDVGPGDDAAVISQTPDTQAVASIDTLVANVHFPATAPAELIGYRALMVSMSDLAAMAATPRYALVALTLPTADVPWVKKMAQGMAEAARACDTYICGGNFAKGELSITVSVHGEVPEGAAVRRDGAQKGDTIYVSGELGAAAACVRLAEFQISNGTLSPLQARYFRPRARLDLVTQLQNHCSAAIDISDGLLADLSHLCAASNVQGSVNSDLIPLHPHAKLRDALSGGDDYELLCTAAIAMPGMTPIGEISAGAGVFLDNQWVETKGFNHFGA